MTPRSTMVSSLSTNRTRRRIGCSALLAGVLALALALPAQAAAKTLVYCSEANPNGFQPALYTDGATFDANRPIYERLVEFKPGTTEVGPGLAESWEIAADGKTYTFHLRHGVRFHSGYGFQPSRDFNADDVLFSLRRQLDKADPYHAVSGGTYNYFDAMGLPTLIRAIDAPDPSTVRIVLNEPNAPFLADLAMDFASIGSAEYAAQLLRSGHPADFDHHPIGTGPYILQDFQSDSMIRYRRFDRYWGGRPALDQLVFAITPNASVRWAKLKAGECQVMAHPNPADLAAMRADPKVKLLSEPGLNIGYLAYNTEKKPLDDARVREALTLAIDRQAIVDAVYQGMGQVAQNPIPPTLWSWDPALGPIAHDPARARRLLAAAGHADGFAIDLWAMPVSRPYMPDARRVAVMVQQDWARIGVRARIVSYEWGEYLKRIGSGEQQATLLGWTGDNGDPDNFFRTLLSCDAAHTAQNAAEFCDARYDQLVLQAARTTDRRRRIALYQQAQARFRQLLPWAPLAHALGVVPVRREVHGYQVWPNGLHVFNGVSLD